MISEKKDYLIEVKSTYKYDVEEAKHISKTTVDRVKAIRDKYLSENEHIIDAQCEEVMTDILVDILRRSLQEDLNK